MSSTKIILNFGESLGGTDVQRYVAERDSLRTVHTNNRYFSPVCDYAGNVDLNNSC